MDTATEGHNSGVAGAELKAFVERIERLNEEIKELNDDKKDVFAEMKGRGFDAAVVKEIIKIRSKDPAELQERDAILDLYKSALGMA